VTVAFVPGGLAGLAQRAMRRLAPTSAPVPAMSGASAPAGFTDVDRAHRFRDDPYAADDPFADDA
jgi:hypothetical protein